MVYGIIFFSASTSSLMDVDIDFPPEADTETSFAVIIAPEQDTSKKDVVPVEDTESSANYQDKIFTTSSDTVSTFTKLLGSFAHMLQKMDLGNELFEELKHREIVNEHSAAIKITDIVSSVEGICKDILINAGNFINFITAKNSQLEIDSSISTCSLIPHDPGLRKPIKTDSERNYLISLGPHQPKLSKFPAHPKNMFNPEWYA